MQIYLEGYSLYCFDWQKAFGARYITGNLSASLEHGKYDDNDVEHGGNAMTKS